jgi:tetratricopeptide (TPR) repeat protein
VHGADADHPGVAASLSNLASVLEAQGDLAESARLHRESLAMLRRLHGADADHPDVATLLANLAVALERRRWSGDLAESVLRHRHALVMMRRLYRDADHPVVAAVLMALANVLFVQGDEREARRLRQQSLEMSGRLRRS